jgi:hypothetical protein
MKKIYGVAVVFLCLAVLLGLHSTASAGGFKAISKVVVTNNATDPNNSNAPLTAVVLLDSTTVPPTLLDFIQAGGRVIGPGATRTFCVRAGEHTVTVQLYNPTTSAPVGAPLLQEPITVVKGQTLRLTITYDGTAPVLTTGDPVPAP